MRPCTQPLYSHYADQSVLAQTPHYEQKDFLGAKFYCLYCQPLLTATIALRRCWRSRQRCHLRRLPHHKQHSYFKHMAR